MNITFFSPQNLDDRKKLPIFACISNTNDMKTDKQMSAAAADFAARWEGRGYERGESQLFWADLLTNVYGVENLPGFLRYEEQVASMVDSTNFIDVHIPSTKVLIEQKSINIDLRKPVKRGDAYITPFLQAKLYIVNMRQSEHPKWVVTCNFQSFLAYDTYLKHLKDRGFKGEQLRLQKQRFYEAYAYLWCSKWTADFARIITVGEGDEQAGKDGHALYRERINGVVANTPDWYDLFGVKPGDKLYRAPEDRITIW